MSQTLPAPANVTQATQGNSLVTVSLYAPAWGTPLYLRFYPEGEETPYEEGPFTPGSGVSVPNVEAGDYELAWWDGSEESPRLALTITLTSDDETPPPTEEPPGEENTTPADVVTITASVRPEHGPCRLTAFMTLPVVRAGRFEPLGVWFGDSSGEGLITLSLPRSTAFLKPDGSAAPGYLLVLSRLAPRLGEQSTLAFARNVAVTQDGTLEALLAEQEDA